MSSSNKHEIRRKLERARTPPSTIAGFPGVSPEGYLETETSRLLPSPSNVPTPSPRSRKNRKIDRIFDGNEHTEEPDRKPRRRPSIEERLRKSAYHMLLEGGQLLSEDEVVDDVDMDVQEPVQSELRKEESSDLQQLQIAPPIPDVSLKMLRPSMVNVLCGRQNPQSWYLTRRLVRMSDSKVGARPGPVTLLKHLNIDPDAAELHRLWRHTGVIPTRYRDINFDPDGIDSRHTWIACSPLINAAIHGYVIEDGEFIDRVMDMLEEKIVKGVRPDVDTISHIFGEKRHHMPMVLQRFLLDRWIDNSIGGFGDVDPDSLPLIFVYAALENAMRHLSHDTRSSPLSGCRYHTHSKLEECYKNRNAQFEASKQERYKYRREKVTREAEQVAAESIKYGIVTMDWESRRAEAHRGLHNHVDNFSLNTSSWTETSGQELEASHPESLQRIGDADASQRETCSDSYPNIRSSSSSVSGTGQADGAVDEVKFAPPAREPPPTPSLSTSVKHHDSATEGEQYIEALPVDHKVAITLCGDAMPVLKAEEAIPPGPDACARAASESSAHQRKRATCP